ncbi:Hansenula MRAKII killer toxin-resistant protein 1 [Actinoplanes sp. NPDC049599]|uniref:Hansenula MRAKII killer toxin-resistant protein 1 n=1 Tax=Actinoplanes sp. NPDC049599 TaxID=3363903 RepID=UPI0037A1E3B7
MAEKGWTAQVAAAAGVAAGTGAAQLGLGYGLGVVEWPAVPADDSVWLGSLGWATWIAASSTVFGAVIAGRLGRAVGGPWRFALAVSAAVGALLTVALIALPARAAVRTETFAPQTIAGGYAVIGVLVGLLIAYWAVVSRPAAANLIATAAWLWSLAVAAVVTTIFWHRPSATYLSSWQFFSPDTAEAQYGIIVWPSALLTLLAAFAVGVIGVLPASRRGDLGVGAAASGAVGPLLVAAAFFVLAPQLTGNPGPLQSAYLIAPYAVLAGLAGSALVVALGQRRSARRSAGGRSEAGAVSAEAENGRTARRPARELAGPDDGERAGTPGDEPDATGTGRAGATNTAAVSGQADRRSAGAVSGKRAGSASDERDGDRQTGAASGRAARGAGGRSAGATADERAKTASGRATGSVSRGNAGKATAVVPSPRLAPADEPKADTRADSDSPAAEPRPRKSFMDRFRRKGGDQDDAPATAKGSAKAQSAAISPAPTGSDTVPGRSPSARPQSTGPDAPSASSGAQTAGAGAASTGSGAAARPGAQAAGPKSGAATGRTGASPARTAASPARTAASPGSESGVSSVDGGARPASSSAPGRSDTRSTVAPPPDSPPIAKINDARSGEKPPAPRKSPARPAGNSTPGPTDAVGSDKTPAARKTPAKATKPPARSTSSAEDDTAELPVQDPKRRGETR